MSFNIGDKIMLDPINRPENQLSVGKCVAMAICECVENIIYQYTGERIELSYDWIYANRKPEDKQLEPLDVYEGLENISNFGIALESQFKHNNIAYPSIKNKLKEVSQDIKDEAMKYALKFDVERLIGYNSVRDAVKYLKEKKMMVVNVYELGHEMCLIGIEYIAKDTYDYFFSNSWGGTGIKVIRGDKLFLHTNETLIPHVLNPEILNRKTVVKMQIDNQKFTVNNVNLLFDVPPQIIDGRTLIPLRLLLEALGYDVEWIAETQEIKVYKRL